MWHAALSTMWALTRDEPFAEFFPAARGLGFSHQELNHHVTEAMIASADARQFAVTSVHEPCPCDIPRPVRQEKGIHISSLNDALRAQAVEWVHGSMRLAHRIGATAVVVHSGEVPVGKAIEREMRELYAEGLSGSDEYVDLMRRFHTERTKRAAPHLEAVRKSLLDLAPLAEALGVRLGLENRDHYYEIPLPDEMAELLTVRPGVIEYWHDAGHAEKMGILGFSSQRDWLERFTDRMIGIHLHDNDGLVDHIAPGLGTIDWDLVSSFVPRDAIRTFEIRGFTTSDQIAVAQGLLHEAGCLQRHDTD